MNVRPLRRGEGPRLRELRLRALRDAPDAFGATAEGDAARPAAHWESLAGTMLLAERDGEWLGMTGAFVDPDLPAIATVWGMWVVPGARGEGIGRRAAGGGAGVGARGRPRPARDHGHRSRAGRGGAVRGVRVPPHGPDAAAARATPRSPSASWRSRFLPALPLETERLRLRLYAEDDLADLWRSSRART